MLFKWQGLEKMNIKKKSMRQRMNTGQQSTKWERDIFMSVNQININGMMTFKV